MTLLQNIYSRFDVFVTYKMSRCVVKFGAHARSFLCSEVEADHFAGLITSEGCDIILVLKDDSKVSITFAVEDMKRCSDTFRELTDKSDSDGDYFSDEQNPKTIDDCVSDVTKHKALNSCIFRLGLLIHSTSTYGAQLSSELRKEIIDYLDRDLLVSLMVFDFLRAVELVNLLLVYNPRQYLSNYIIHSFNLESHMVVKLFSLGYRLNFDVLVDKVQDTETFLKAVEYGMPVVKISVGDYVTNDILEFCDMLKYLNVDSNSYVTRLGPSAPMLEELHCCRSSGIRQDQIDLCTNLKYLYIDDNSSVIMCHPGVEVLSIRGARNMEYNFICSLANLRELSITFSADIITIPRSVTKLHLYGYCGCKHSVDCKYVEYLEIEDNRMHVDVGVSLKSLVINSAKGNIAENVHGILDAVNIETLIIGYGYLIDFTHFTELRHLETSVVQIDLIANPEKLEILKVDMFTDGTNLDPRQLRNLIHTLDTRRYHYARYNPVMHCNINVFTNLRILHIKWPDCSVGLSEDFHLEELACDSFTGQMRGLKRLIILGSYYPSDFELWTDENKASIEYLEVGEEEDDMSGCPNLKEYRSRQFESSNIMPIPGAMLTMDVLSYRSDIIHHLQAGNEEEATLEFIYEDYARQTKRPFILYSDIFANLKILDLERAIFGYEDGIRIDCKQLPLLEELRVSRSIRIMYLDTLKRLERLVTYDISLFDYGCLVESDDYDNACISNPLLKYLNIEISAFGLVRHNMGRKIITIESKWLKHLIIRGAENDGECYVDELIINTPHIEELTLRGCRTVKVGGGAGFTSLIVYDANILIDLQRSKNTLQTIVLPSGDKINTDHLDNILFPFLKRGSITRDDTMEWINRNKKSSKHKKKSGIDYGGDDSDEPRLLPRKRSTYDSDQEIPTSIKPRVAKPNLKFRNGEPVQKPAPESVNMATAADESDDTERRLGPIKITRRQGRHNNSAVGQLKPAKPARMHDDSEDSDSKSRKQAKPAKIRDDDYDSDFNFEHLTKAKPARMHDDSKDSDGGSSSCIQGGRLCKPSRPYYDSDEPKPSVRRLVVKRKDSSDSDDPKPLRRGPIVIPERKDSSDSDSDRGPVRVVKHQDPNESESSSNDAPQGRIMRKYHTNYESDDSD